MTNQLIPTAPIMPSPLPTQIAMDQVPLRNQDGSEHMGIQIQFITPQGVSVFFLDSQTALTVGTDLAALATQSKTGLHVVKA